MAARRVAALRLMLAAYPVEAVLLGGSVFPGPVAMVAVGSILAVSGFILFRVGLYIGR